MTKIILHFSIFILLTSCVRESNTNQELEESNKKVILQFYQKAFNELDTNAVDEFISEPYIQHNPNVPNGKKPVKELISWLATNQPKGVNEFKRIIADSDYVVLHVRYVPNDSANVELACVDIFKLKNGKITEHWDVQQNVPAKSANTNTMF
ncbi:MAG: ester cyclase [Cytophagales bacterium]|nr:ester cyclase [Cytophagales bacterium]